MELIKGFKTTEIGKIPEDWASKKFEEIGKVIDGDRGVNYPSDNEFFNDGYCLFLSAKNVTKDGFKFSECTFITKEKDELLNNGKLSKGDIVLTTRGTIGNVAFFGDVPFDNMRINSGMVILRNESSDFDNVYLYTVLKSQIIKRQISEMVFGSAQPQLTVKIINNFNIPCPPLQEQQAIVSVLSDVDTLIVKLEDLIAKKNKIKKATMQQLLTGKKRLPGFVEGKSGYQQTELGPIPLDWELKNFGDVITGFTSGATPYRGKPEYYKGNIRWVTSGELNYNIIYDSVEKITAEAVKDTNLKIHPKGTFLIAITGLEAEGTRGSCGILGADSTTNQSCMALFPTDKLLTDYLFHFYVNYGDYLAKVYCQGTKQQSYTANIVKILPIIVPPLPEQQAIAQVLSDIDAEILALEARLEKTRALKQGMIEELLTGRIRLK